MDILETTGVLSALRQGYGSSHKRIAACENAESKCCENATVRENVGTGEVRECEERNAAKLRPYARTSACENAKSKSFKNATVCENSGV